VPSLFLSLTSHSTTGRIDLALLALATIATVGLLTPRGGMRRAGAAIIVTLYAVFVAVTLS
jgi:hypothetical protein